MGGGEQEKKSELWKLDIIIYIFFDFCIFVKFNSTGFAVC